jgi:glutamyl/glutaminyl-tRNA synthetase
LRLEGLGSDVQSSAILAMLRPRCKKLTDFHEQLKPFFEDPETYDADGVKKHLSAPGTVDHLRALRDVYERSEWNAESLEKDLRHLADALKLKPATLIHGTRLAMTGRMVSPGLFDMLVVLGRPSVLRRLDRLAESL